jgi:putative hydrolase of the HAD superfamily
MSIPFGSLDTIFLDAGNTLISVDFEWMAAELHARGLPCSAEQLCRAEAAGRPAVSRRVAAQHGTESEDSFHFYLQGIVSRLAAAQALPRERQDSLIVELAGVLRFPGQSKRLWRRVIPGVPEALGQLRAAGLRLVVVSNADGSVEAGLSEIGLRPFFEAVHDSWKLGFEKPDPRIFQHALHTLHVGDLYAADVVGARAAGIHPLLLDPFGDWTDADADCVRLPDLPAVAQAVLGARAAAPRGAPRGIQRVE